MQDHDWYVQGVRNASHEVEGGYAGTGTKSRPSCNSGFPHPALDYNCHVLFQHQFGCLWDQAPRFSQVVTSYLETAKESLEDRKALEEQRGGPSGGAVAAAAAAQGVDLFEAQKALKMQPQVLAELADLRSRLEQTERQAAEVNCQVLHSANHSHFPCCTSSAIGAAPRCVGGSNDW